MCDTSLPVLSLHYEEIAKQFWDYWSFEDDFRDEFIAKAKSALDLNSSSKLVDLGGGTGSTGQLLAESANTVKWYCVDPSASMLREAKQRGATVWKGDCHSFVDQFPFDYDRVLMKEVIHHVRDRPGFFRALQQHQMHSPDPTKVLIVTRPKHIGWPMFKQARIEWAKEQPSLEELLQECQTHVPWRKVDAYIESFPVAIPRTQWCTMLRRRFSSNLRAFTDAEIEEGIQQLEAEWKENNTLQDKMIYFTDDLIFVELHC